MDWKKLLEGPDGLIALVIAGVVGGAAWKVVEVVQQFAKQTLTLRKQADDASVAVHAAVLATQTQQLIAWSTQMIALGLLVISLVIACIGVTILGVLMKLFLVALIGILLSILAFTLTYMHLTRAMRVSARVITHLEEDAATKARRQQGQPL